MDFHNKYLFTLGIVWIVLLAYYVLSENISASIVAIFMIAFCFLESCKD